MAAWEMSVPRPLLLSFALAVLVGLAAPAAAQSKDEDPVVAKVAGTEIRRSEVEALLEEYGEHLAGIEPGKRFEFGLERVIDMHLIARAARRADLDDDPAVKRRLAAAERAVLQEALIGRLIETETTEKALKERYDRVYHEGKGIREVQARHILTYTQGAAEEIIRELKAGADFVELAKEKSVDSRTAAKGGELGWIGEDNASRPFVKAATAIPVGKYGAEPVETEHGWHVIMVEGERFKKGPTFEQAREQLAQDAVEEAISSLLREMREDVKIERVEDAGLAAKKK